MSKVGQKEIQAQQRVIQLIGQVIRDQTSGIRLGTQL